MNKKINWTAVLSIGVIILMVINIVALITIISINKKKQSSERKEPPYFHDFMNKELNLTEKQKDSFYLLRHEFMMSGKSQLATIRNYQDSIFIELMKPNPDTLKIDLYNAQIQSVQKDLMKISYQHFLKIKEILDTNQQKKYFRFLYHKIRKMHPDAGSKKGCCPNDFPPPPYFEDEFNQ